jgi:hypothetical protein
MPAKSRWIVVDKDGTVRPCTNREALKIINSNAVKGEILAEWEDEGVPVEEEVEGGSGGVMAVVVGQQQLPAVRAVMYGNRKISRKGQENYYDFPPPLNDIRLFGPCVARVFPSELDGHTFHLKMQEWSGEVITPEKLVAKPIVKVKKETKKMRLLKLAAAAAATPVTEEEEDEESEDDGAEEERPPLEKEIPIPIPSDVDLCEDESGLLYIGTY